MHTFTQWLRSLPQRVRKAVSDRITIIEAAGVALVVVVGSASALRLAFTGRVLLAFLTLACMTAMAFAGIALITRHSKTAPIKHVSGVAEDAAPARAPARNR